MKMMKMDINNACVVMYRHRPVRMNSLGFEGSSIVENLESSRYTDAIGETQEVLAGTKHDFGVVQVYNHMTKTLYGIERYRENVSSVAVPINELIGTWIHQESSDLLYEFIEITPHYDSETHKLKDYVYKMKCISTGATVTLATSNCRTRKYKLFIEEFSLRDMEYSEAFTRYNSIKEQYKELKTQMEG